MKRQDRLERIAAVWREYAVARLATERLTIALQADPSLLSKARLRPVDARNLADNLESTYLLRLFAELEAGLREAWENCFKQTTVPRVKDLLDAVAARSYVPDDVLASAHAVRKYRNSLVHEGGEEAEAVPLEDAKSQLCTFFSRLPLDW